MRETGQLIGPAVAGGLMMLSSPQLVLAVNAVSFAASALLVSRLRGRLNAPEFEETEETGPTTVRDVLSSFFRIVTMRSTRVPGSRKPATPMTSFTFTDIARMPRGIAGARPDPPVDESLLTVMGSFSSTAVRRPRLTAISGAANEEAARQSGYARPGERVYLITEAPSPSPSPPAATPAP